MSLNRLLILSVIFFLPVIDAMQGTMEILNISIPSLSMLGRVFLIFSVFLLFIFVKQLYAEWFLLLFLFVLLLGSVLYWISQGYSYISSGINVFIKSFFILVVIKLLNHAVSVRELSLVFRAVFSVIFIYFFLFVFSLLTGFGNYTYGDYSFGIKSVFISGNDIALMMFVYGGISLLGYKVMSFKRGILCAYLCASCMLLIASKTGMLLAVILLFYSTYYLWFLKNVHPLILAVIKLSISTVFIGVVGVVASFISILQESFSRQLSDALELMDTLQGPRAFLIDYAMYVYANFSNTDFIFGRGGQFFSEIGNFFYRFNLRENTTPRIRATESDFYDLVGTLGYGSFFVLVSIYACVLFFLLSTWKKTKDGIFLVLFVFIFLVFIHSMVAGHVMYSSQVAYIVGVLFILGKVSKQTFLRGANAVC